MNVEELHVGRGVDWEGLTVFPVWRPSEGDAGYTLATDSLTVSECDDGPEVEGLMVANGGPDPVLVLEGQLFEGGWQHRMALTGHLVGAGERVRVDVACVEQGRWHGEVDQRTGGRRATPYVRQAATDAQPWGAQQEVWRRVERLTSVAGGADNPTTSLVRHLDEELPLLSAELPSVLPGQTGVLVGVGGQPYVMEVFDSTAALDAALEQILEAARVDARGLASEPTPSRRALRMVRRCEQVQPDERGPAGLAEWTAGRTSYAGVRHTTWGGRTLHSRLTNLRHPILLEA